MNKVALGLTYSASVAFLLSLFFGSCGLLGKVKLLVVVLLALFLLVMSGKPKNIFQKFNFIYAMALLVFAIYALLFKDLLYPQVRLMMLLGGILGLFMTFYYRPKKRRMVPPPKPIVRKVQTKQTSTKVATNTAPTKTVKKSTKKSVKKTTKKSAKKSAKKSTKNRAADAKRISFSKDHEVAYVLRKYKKRITKKNKEVIKEQGKKFKSLSSYKPHNRESFYNFVKKYKVLSKLE